MPCRLEVVQAYVEGRKFKTLKAAKDFDFQRLEPYIIPSQRRRSVYHSHSPLTPLPSPSSNCFCVGCCLLVQKAAVLYSHKPLHEQRASGSGASLEGKEIQTSS